MNFKNMYAIAEIAGKQYKVEKDKSIYINKLPEKEGAKVEFDKILLIKFVFIK